MDTLLNQIRNTTREAGEIILRSSVEERISFAKGGRANYVTVYDEKVQDYLFTKFRDLLPDAHFLGEEEGQDNFLSGYEKGYTFVIDPIDGTTNFMKDCHLSVTSVALFRDGEPFIGVVYNPYTGEMFWAEKNKGAFCNGAGIHTSEDDLSHSLVNMGTAPYCEDHISLSAFRIAHWYLQRSLDIRRSGSAAFDLCMVAAGRTGVFFEPYLSLWDYAAGGLIVTEAGGKVTDLHGNALSWRGPVSICAVTAGVAKEAYLPPKELVVF
ncbi:MAG: inositol monophosphatase [Lachnospiraceae bacterium]|nr:inositol monophosphatase [Lachnospiraceae bacterium]